LKILPHLKNVVTYSDISARIQKLHRPKAHGRWKCICVGECDRELKLTQEDQPLRHELIVQRNNVQTNTESVQCISVAYSKVCITEIIELCRP